ncbi:hypothetical protein DM02DRAFT_211298 [Periconia macrospinosa]|uniref:Uncharacterized protein n=1 Tax=Periconia macrospinosa TaxID=97972 RepID=A0A2V1D744_9PLEO|nr:hypothetical protein DM02DRAFT_211298 [Periconia macrospinosa]
MSMSSYIFLFASGLHTCKWPNIQTGKNLGDQYKVTSHIELVKYHKTLYESDDSLFGFQNLICRYCTYIHM